MKIGIRLDVSTAIGTGHVKRMLAVAQALRILGADVLFICRKLDLDIREMVAPHGFTLHLLPPPSARRFVPNSAIPHAAWAEVAQEKDASETVEAVIDGSVDAMIVDHYAFDARWHRSVDLALGGPLMVIDDLADRQIAGEWLVDHNYHPDHVAKYAGWVAPRMSMLAGPAYAMLGPAYAKAPRYKFARNVGSIGIFMGGVDLNLDSVRMLEALNQIGWKGLVEIVSTRANPRLSRLESAVAERPHTTLLIDLPDLAAFFARHDMQIGAGGGATWERCCIGPPTVCLVCAPNQRLSVPFLDAAGVVAGYDLLNDAPPQKVSLAQTIESVLQDQNRREAMNAAATALVDGLGASRVAEAILAR